MKEQQKKPVPSQKFHKFVSKTIAFETGGDRDGGYTNDPDDKGGKTKWGISSKSYPSLVIEDITFNQAKQIYYNDYYSYLYEMIMSDRIAFKLFDMSVVSGKKRTIKRLQRAIVATTGQLIKIDGIFGPLTLTALNTGIAQHSKEVDIFANFIARQRRYFRLISKFGKNKKYLTGWLKRLSYEWK